MSLKQKYHLFKIALKYSAISQVKIKHWCNKKINNQPNFPGLVRFFLFYGCNLRCFMCGQWGEKGTSEITETKNFLTLEKLKHLADEIAPHNSEIYLWGGEPTLHPNFLDFIAYLKNKKLTVTINTNGILLEKFASAIMTHKVDSLDISLLGTEEIHDRVVGVPGAFKKVLTGLNKFPAKKSAANFKPLIKAIITLNLANLDCLPDLLTEIETIPAIDLSIIQLGWFTTQKSGAAYEARMQKDFNLAAKSWVGFLNENIDAQAEKIQKLLTTIKNNKSYKKPILLFPNIKIKDLARYYHDHQHSFGYKKCGALKREIDIRHNGTVVICADFPDYIIGNLNQETIQQIWQGELLKKFRINLKEKGLLPICSRCCGLFR